MFTDRLLSKAFDTVDHVILVPKLLKLDLPVSVANWIYYYVLFLQGVVNSAKLMN